MSFVYPPYMPYEPPFGPREYPCQKNNCYDQCFRALSEQYDIPDKRLLPNTTLYRGKICNATLCYSIRKFF